MIKNAVAVNDPRNSTNDLSNEEWLSRSSSIHLPPGENDLLMGMQPYLDQARLALLGALSQENSEEIFGNPLPPVASYPFVAPDRYDITHPASFDEREVVSLIELFTKKGNLVLDPMCGSGTALTASLKTERVGVGIELMDRWFEVAKRRISEAIGCEYTYGMKNLFLKKGDCLEILPKIKAESIDFIITSPPYFNILKEAKGPRFKYRKGLGLEVDYGQSEKDLGRIDDYRAFLNQMKKVYLECFRLVKKGKFMTVIVADIIPNGRFIPYHLDTIDAVCDSGFKLAGIQVILDHWKRCTDRGIPYRFFLNFHHHYALVFQK
jgi:DNA modification methylase